MILHHDHAFAEDAVFNNKVCLSLRYNAAAAQAPLIFITAHFETSALLSSQYYNTQYFVSGGGNCVQKTSAKSRRIKLKEIKRHTETCRILFSSKKN
jgi:hypothetical protein